MSRIGSVAIVVVAVTAVTVLGYKVGSLLGESRVQRVEANRDQKLQADLERGIRGIGAGMPLPEFPVWSTDGKSSLMSTEILPHGGLLVYLSAGCESCKETVKALEEAMHQAKHKPKDVAVLLLGPVGQFGEFLSSEGISIPLYCDLQEVLARDYGANVIPTAYLVDDRGYLKSITAGTDRQDEFEALLNE